VRRWTRHLHAAQSTGRLTGARSAPLSNSCTTPLHVSAPNATTTLNRHIQQDMLDLVDLEWKREPGSVPSRQGGFDLIWDGGPVVAGFDRPTSLPSMLGCFNPNDKTQQRRPLAEVAAEEKAAKEGGGGGGGAGSFRRARQPQQLKGGGAGDVSSSSNVSTRGGGGGR